MKPAVSDLKRRFRVEQAFSTLKRLSGLQRAGYFGIAKTHAQMVMAAISSNLPKAANRITFNPKNLAIAQNQITEPLRPIIAAKTD